MRMRDTVFLEHCICSEEEAVLAGHSVETPLAPLQKNVERLFLFVSGFWIKFVAEGL